MKICVTSTGPNLDDIVDPRFGRCQFFIIIDTDTMQFEAFDNAAIGASGGAGVQSSRFVADNGAEAVLTGNVGPNAYSGLNSLGIRIFTGVANITVREAVSEFKSGRFNEIEGPSVQSHFGMGGGGMGMGSGRGMGMGRGMGSGRGMGMGRGMQNAGSPVQQQPGASPSGKNEIDSLKEEAAKMQEQLAKIQNRIEELTDKK